MSENSGNNHQRKHGKKKPAKRGFSTIDYVGISLVFLLIIILLSIVIFDIKFNI